LLEEDTHQHDVFDSVQRHVERVNGSDTRERCRKKSRSSGEPIVEIGLLINRLTNDLTIDPD
jgi:hypothetical protein